MVLSEELLREYARNGSEEAFRQLVERHLRMVYATARRLAGGDGHLAEDIAQTVFSDLAQKANRLSSGTIVAGWLYRHTCFTTSKILRTNRRRAAREEKATGMNDGEETSAVAERLEPILARLGETDRDAVALRYLEERDWDEVGAVLGVSVEAAQKRASRALEKLRRMLEGEGLRVSSITLAGVMAARGEAAPASLGGKIAMSALKGKSMNTGVIGTLKAKIAIGTCAVGVVVVTPWLLQRQQLAAAGAENSALREENAALQRQVADAVAMRDEIAGLRRDNAELHKLRAEIGSLRRELAEARAAESRERRASVPVANEAKKQVMISAKMAAVPEEVFSDIRALGINPPVESGSTVINRTQAETLDKFLQERQGIDLIARPKVTTLDGRQARISVEDIVTLGDGTQMPVGQVVDAWPEISQDGSSTSLKIETKATEFLGYGEVNGQQLPRVRVRQAVSQSVVRNGETVLIQAQDQPGSAPGDGRKLLVLVTTSVINANGYPAD